MELIPEEGFIKFYGLTNLERIFSKTHGGLEVHGLKNEPVTFVGDDSISIRLFRNGQFINRMILDKSGIQLRAINSFELKDPGNGNTIFTTHRPQYNIPQGVNSLISKSVSASRIESPLGQSLNFEVDGRIFSKGSEGVMLDAFGVFLQAENIILNSTQNSVLESSNILLDMDKIPIVTSELGLRTGSVSYKICVCMPQGVLFRISVPRTYNGPKVSCAWVNPKNDPCAFN